MSYKFILKSILKYQTNLLSLFTIISFIKINEGNNERMMIAQHRLLNALLLTNEILEFRTAYKNVVISLND